MECFLDTNIPLAYVFSIEPNHKKANYIFNEYDKLFWSKLVLNEFNNRFNIKYQHITDFYQEYKFFLKHSSKENIQIGDIEKYARKKDYPKKYEKDVLESISLFWNKYLGIETFVEIHRFLSKINDFLNDLKKSRYHNKNHCQQRIIITNNIKERTDDYTDYYNKLLLFNMQENDALIILDAHDFSKYYDNLLDFVTFDNNCYNGASSLPNLAFNKVKGITDFNHIK